MGSCGELSGVARLALVLVLALGCSRPPEPGHPTPEGAVATFFEAVKRRDDVAVRAVVLPARAAALDKSAGWTTFMGEWGRCQPVDVQAPVLLAGGAEASVQVRYDCDGVALEDSVRVRRVEERWYWDEN